MEFGKDKPKRRTRDRRRREPRASAKSSAKEATGEKSDGKSESSAAEATKYPPSDARSSRSSGSRSSSSLTSRKSKRGPRRGKSLIVEREMAFPLRYMGLLIGPKGRNINFIQRASKCRIWADFEDDAPRPKVAGEVRAPLTSSDDTGLIKDTLSSTEDLKEDIRGGIRSPNRPVALLIGTSAVSSSAADSSSKSEESIKPDRNTEMRRILMAGSPEEIDAATRELQFIIDKGRLMLESERGFSVPSSSMSRDMSGYGYDDDDADDVDGSGRKKKREEEMAEEMRIPTKVCGMLIGSEGERIKEIQELTGAEVYVKWDDGLSRDERQHIEASVSTVTIKGSKRAIDLAKKEIRNVLSLFGGAGGKGGSDCIFEIPAHATKHLLGTRGARGDVSSGESVIKELQRIFKVTISIKTPTQVQNYDLLGKKVQRISIVQIVGEESDIRAVRQEIADLIGTFRKCDECKFLVEPSEGKHDSNGWNWYCLKCWVEWGGDSETELAEEMARMKVRRDGGAGAGRGGSGHRRRDRDGSRDEYRYSSYHATSAVPAADPDHSYYHESSRMDESPVTLSMAERSSLKYGMMRVNNNNNGYDPRPESGTMYGGEDMDLEGFQSWEDQTEGYVEPHRGRDRYDRYESSERRRKPPRPSVHY